MPSISIIATLDANAAGIEELAGTLASQTSKEFELVCVGGRSSDFKAAADAAGLDCKVAEAAAADDADTPGVPAMRMAGLAAATGDYVLFVNDLMRLAPGTVEVLARSAENTKRDKVDVYAFHMQVLDLSTGEYLTRRYALRRQNVTPFDPFGKADMAFQQFGANLGGMLVSREHLLALASQVQEDGVSGFRSENLVDDEPLAMLALARARNVVNLKWPLTGIVHDHLDFIQTMVASQLEQRLSMAAGMSQLFASQTSGLAPFKRSYLEWLVEFSLDGLDRQSPGMQERLMDMIGRIVAPVVAELREPGMNIGDWENLRKVELCGKSRMQLMDEHVEAERNLLERVYRLECDIIRGGKGGVSGSGSESSEGEGKKKRRGLFRR